jgi:arginyl-tRNA synthetase
MFRFVQKGVLETKVVTFVTYVDAHAYPKNPVSFGLIFHPRGKAMLSLKEKLTALFAGAFEACQFDPKFGEVVLSQRPDLGQFQCNGALPAARVYKQNPRQIAQAVLDALKDGGIFANLSVAGPGFINITLTDDFLAEHIQEMAADERLSCPPVENPRNVVIDFGSPNVAKPMHVGHLRSSIIGDSLQRLYRFRGDHVIGDNHLGDWGVQMGMIIYELSLRQPDLPYFDPDYSGPYPEEPPISIDELEELYPAIAARSETDPAVREAVRQATVDLQQGRPGYRALWQHMVNVSNAEQKADFETLGITFDHWYGESHYHNMIPPMIERLRETGHAQVSRGAVVVPLTPEEEEQEIPPLILVKSDGAYMYGTTDLATVILRVDEFKADLILYVIDERQSFHLKQVFLAAKQTGLAPDTELVHVAFGTVNGPDGKPFKTRAGGVMRLKDLIKMITDKALERMAESGVATDFDEAECMDVARKVGIAALKFADLMNDRTSGYILDLDQFSRFEGRTGPYLLYTAVRIKSIMRKAAEQSLSPGPILPPTPAERNLMLTATQLPEAVQRAYEDYSPKHLCDFAYSLAVVFNQFYNQCHILSEEDPARQASWLALVKLCLDQLDLTLSLLGIEIPERM